MKYGNSVSRILGLVLIVFMGQFAMSAHALNRNDIFAEIEKIDTNWNDISIKLWINDFENDPDPGVLVGDRLVYQVRTDKPAFFVFIFVDSKGSVAVLKPDALAVSGITGASQTLKFPGDEESASGQGLIIQADPLGKETIYLLATDQNLPVEAFNFDALSDYVNYGTDIAEVRDLVTRLNAFSQTTKLAVARYEYLVDSDTQFSTRGIRREISDRISEVEATATPVVIVSAERTDDVVPVQSAPLAINDINFEYDSDVLTSTGINQLEILGSELVDRQAQNDLPRILLTGHTDSIGSASYNMALSEKRSMASKRFLVDELGLPAEYIETHGMGEAAPIDSNGTDIGRSKNRRVEFVIVQ